MALGLRIAAQGYPEAKFFYFHHQPFLVDVLCSTFECVNSSGPE